MKGAKRRRRQRRLRFVAFLFATHLRRTQRDGPPHDAIRKRRIRIAPRSRPSRCIIRHHHVLPIESARTRHDVDAPRGQVNVYHPILLLLPNRADRHRESSTSGIVVERATRARREGRAVTLGRLCLGLEAHGPGAAEGDADDGLAPAVA